jgi:hypothetical protein
MIILSFNVQGLGGALKWLSLLTNVHGAQTLCNFASRNDVLWVIGCRSFVLIF